MRYMRKNSERELYITLTSNIFQATCGSNCSTFLHRIPSLTVTGSHHTLPKRILPHIAGIAKSGTEIDIALIFFYLITQWGVLSEKKLVHTYWHFHTWPILVEKWSWQLRLWHTEMCRIWQKNQYILGYSSRTICRRDLEMV